MEKILHIIFIFLAINNLTYSQINIINPGIPDFGKLKGSPCLTGHNIYFLKFIDDNKLCIRFHRYSASCYPEYIFCGIEEPYIYTWNIKDNKSEGIVNEIIPAKKIIFDASSVYDNKAPWKQIILDGAGTKVFITENQDYGTKFGLNSVDITKKNFYRNIIGGTINYSMYHKPNTGFYQPMIWNSNGFILYAGNYFRQFNVNVSPIQSSFSPQDNFFIVRGLIFNHIEMWWSYDLNYSSSEYQFPYSSIKNGLSTCLSLIYQENVNDKRKWNQINDFFKDAAFTSDDQYMITEWQGKPTLFKTPDFKTVVKQYEVPSYMTACTFSPDNKLVYIACEDHKIYVFDIGLPAAVKNWEIH